MTIVDMTKAQCAELANYLRAILNNGMGAGCFDKMEMLVLARLALESAEDLPENIRSPAPPLRRWTRPLILPAPAAVRRKPPSLSVLRWRGWRSTAVPEG